MKQAIQLTNVQVINRSETKQHLDSLLIPISRGSVFGNPYTIKESGSREQAIELYRQHIWAAISAEKPTPQEKALVKALRNLTRAASSGAQIRLVCHCSPKACHGDTIVKFLHWAVNKMLANQVAKARK